MRKNVLSLMLLASLALLAPASGFAQMQCSALFESAGSRTSAQVLNLKNYVENYAAIVTPVADMISLAVERYSGRKPRGYCYNAVKGLLVDSGLVRKAIEGTFASSAHTKNFLVNRGFINLLERAPFASEIRGALDSHIPVGAVLVYEGTNGVDGGLRPLGEGIGHIEIKCGANCYAFDTINEFPGGAGGGSIRTQGSFVGGDGLAQRRLIGVYVLDYFSLF